ncbi:SUKH-3 domain-containing protein [Streptomyces olivaceus]|uniref:SUKH-3 domain-containing protein n=1 Tax=Streptomyces olivaceus TaxID=47716 RepID=UPI0037A95561
MTEGVLRKAGWQPGRRVPTATWEAVLPERGSYEAHDAARRFLAEFGGLTTYGWPADSVTTSAAVCFDPLRAAWQDERFSRASRETGVALCPAGTADEGAGLVGVGDDGTLYLIRDGVEKLGGLDRLVQAQGAQSDLWKPTEPVQEDVFWRRLRASGKGTDTERLLRAAGWSSGRSVPTDTWEALLLENGEFEMHDAAHRFLSEFGALGVPHREQGSAPYMEFSLDPLLALWDGEIIDDLAEQAGADLYPLGTRDRGNQYLAMAEDGSVFAGMDNVWLLAGTPDEALERLTTALQPTDRSG